MKTIVLTEEQRNKVIDALADVREEKEFNVEIELNDTLTIEASGSVEVNGYTEDDYYNGTGAWVETYRSAQIELTAVVYNEEENDVTEYNVDAASEQAARDYLNKVA